VKAITVKQPFAALIAAGAKRTEHRKFRPLSVLRTRGNRLAIHAGMDKPSTADIEEAERIARDNRYWRAAKPVLSEDPASWAYGRVVAVVTVGEPKSVDGVDGEWLWPLSDVRAATSAKVRGQQRVFDIPTRQIRYVS